MLSVCVYCTYRLCVYIVCARVRVTTGEGFNGGGLVVVDTLACSPKQIIIC